MIKISIIIKFFDIFRTIATKMSNILKKFPIFLKIDLKLREKIKIFNIFDNGCRILFITDEDNVYSLCLVERSCWLSSVNSMEVQIIPELCHQKVKQFFNGFQFMLALNSQNKVFSWEKQNDHGQLGRGNTGDSTQNARPVPIHFKNENFINIAVGKFHCLALTTQGYVYGWGDNEYGQIGCGRNWLSKTISTP